MYHMWHIILNCVVISIVIALSTFGGMFAEMMIAAETPQRASKRNNYPAQQQQQQYYR